MKPAYHRLVFFCILLHSCTIPRDARTLKNTTKEWRESTIVFHAYADSPFSGLFLTLRENGKFEHTSSGVIKSFEAGTWTFSQDTIHLVYLDYNLHEINIQNVIIDRKTVTLNFEGDSIPVQMRMRIMKNEIDN